MLSYFIKGDFVCIGIADGLDKRGCVVRKVLKFHDPTLALDEVYNGLGDPTFVKPIFAMSDKLAECIGKGG